MSHGGFIFAAYALTAAVLLGVIGMIVADHAALRRALDKFPGRDARQQDES